MHEGSVVGVVYRNRVQVSEAVVQRDIECRAAYERCQPWHLVLKAPGGIEALMEPRQFFLDACLTVLQRMAARFHIQPRARELQRELLQGGQPRLI